MGLRENREAGVHQMVRSENKTLREEEREKIKGRDEGSLYTRWPKSSPGLDFGRSLTRHDPDPASLDSTASKDASLYSTVSKGAAATASKGAPATASKDAPATASKGAAPWRSVCVVVRTLGQLHGRAVTKTLFCRTTQFNNARTPLSRFVF